MIFEFDGDNVVDASNRFLGPSPELDGDEPDGDVVSLRTGRAAIRGPELRASIIGYMAKIARAIGRGIPRPPKATYASGTGEKRFEITEDDTPRTADVRGMFTVLITDEAPIVFWRGEIDWDDVNNAQLAMRDIYTERWRHRRDEGLTYNQTVEMQWELRRRHRERADAAVAEKRAAKPWRCEFCDRGYVHKGRAERHEGECWRNPNADRYRSGEYRASLNADGKVTGYWLARRPS